MTNETLKKFGITDDQSEAKQLTAKLITQKESKIIDLLSSAVGPTSIGSVINTAIPAIQQIKQLFGNALKPTEVEAVQDSVGDVSVTVAYELNELSLQIVKTKIDLIPFMLTIDISEKDDNFISGLMTVRSDTDGVFDNLPLSGINNLIIDWSITQGNKTKVRKKLFATVTKIVPMLLPQAGHRVFSLNFVASDVAKDWPNAMSRSYRNITLYDLLNKLLADLNPLIVQPDITLQPEDAGIVIDHFVTNGFPNTLTAMNNALLAYAKNAYRFYQRLTDKGQQFVIKPISSIQPLNIEYSVGKTIGIEGEQNAVKDRYVTVDHKPIESTDWEYISTQGGIASTSVVASPCRKRIMRQTYDLLSDSSPIIAEKSGKYLPFYLFKGVHAMRPTEESCVFILPDKTDSVTGNRTTLLIDRAKNRISPLALQNMSKIEMYTGGNASLGPGKSIIITFPSSDLVLQNNDDHLSGRWEIRYISHLMGSKGHYMCTFLASKSRVDTPYGTVQPLLEESTIKQPVVSIINRS